MKTENELIAEFMGRATEYRYNRRSPSKKRVKIKLKYDTSWDWLMPVVEKITEIFDKNFPPGEEFVKRILAHEEPIEKEYMEVVGLPLSTPIKEAYDAVVTFIKWYNSQNINH